MFKKEIISLIKKQGLDQSLIEAPKDPKLGDYAVPCFTLAKKYKKSPAEVAKSLKEKLKPSKSIEKIENHGPYLNFFIKKQILNKSIIETKPKTKKIKKTIVIDFSSPNIMKPFNIAHLRSTMIGNSLYKIHKHLGYKVVGVNHLGDWGTQFGKMIYAFEKWGNKTQLKKDPINYMLKLYVKFHNQAEKTPKLVDKGREWFSKLEKGDKKARLYWKQFKELSVKEYEKTYKRLNVKFDSWAGEAFYEQYLESTVKELKRKNLLKESEGALIVNLKKQNLAPCLIKKSDGSTLYATRDIATAIYRAKKYKFHKNLYVVDVRQSLHFQQFFKVLELSGYKWAKDCEHISFGMMNFKGLVMSTRKGRVVLLEKLLDESVDKVLKIIKKKNPNLKNKKKVAEQVGIGAIVFWDLSHDRVKDITFEWDKVLDFEGETAPYIQYTHARACSILRKAKNNYKPDYNKLIDEKERNLIKHISLFEESVQQAAKQYKPHVLAKYIYELAQKFNEFYNRCPCINIDDKQLSKARLNLVRKTKDTIKQGLELLGIDSPKEM